MTVVGGVPARVLREITDADREWTYRAPRTLDVPGPGPRIVPAAAPGTAV